MKRSRLKKVGRRAERDKAALVQFREGIMEKCRLQRGFEAVYCCERCGCDTEIDQFHAHHLKPRSRGGKHELANGAGLCQWCHTEVHDHTAEDWKDWVR